MTITNISALPGDAGDADLCAGQIAPGRPAGVCRPGAKLSLAARQYKLARYPGSKNRLF
jgi:hypothetical protein